MHWLVYRDGLGWGCSGCDWAGKLADFYIQEPHRKQDDDINIPF